MTLFDIGPEPEPSESADQQRTRRQRALLDEGLHPLSSPLRIRLRLHPDAPPPADRQAAGPRCGTCRFRQPVSNGNRCFPKCLLGWDGNPGHDPPYASHGAATDIRAWWPACEHFEPGTGPAGRS